MQLKQVTIPVIAVGSALFRGLVETMALQRARRRVAAHDAALRAAGQPARRQTTKH